MSPASFGGPAGQIAVMHRIIVEEKKWIGETRFLHALNYCMLLPGRRPSNWPSISAG
jgi:chromate transporter